MTTATAPRLQKLTGVRAQETQTVWLFFFHNFFLGIGTILVYVAANVILLENNPTTSLPLAYIAAALVMMAVGYGYAYFEHHLVLRSLALRVLWAVVVLTAVIGVVVYAGHSVAAAVAIMTGYRVIYLLTNLEFWGVSAVVFDIRQGKRLFGVISAGDMPAKALGAILAALVHAHTDILFLLLVAFGAFLGANYTLRRTFEAHDVHAPHRPPRATRRTRPPLIQRLFGGSELVLFMCLSLGALATVYTQIEYNFFINVKHKFHDQTTVIQYVGYVLTLTYLVATVAKVVLSRQSLDRFGVARSLLVLPLAAVGGLLVLEGLLALGLGETGLLIYFCGLYLVFEVLRRALFDPVFLVLFQPLSPSQRLKGHTVAKGFYEPLGMGFAGVLIYLTQATATNGWIIGVWLVLLVGMIQLLRHTYRHYLDELKDAVARRFVEGSQLAMPTTALALVMSQLRGDKPEEIGVAIDWLEQHQPEALTEPAPTLLDHPEASVRRRALEAIGTRHLPVPSGPLYHLVFNDPEPDLRELAARLLGRRVDTEPEERLAPLLRHTNLAIRRGAIRGCLELQPDHPAARRGLDALADSGDPAQQRAALNTIEALKINRFAPFVRRCLDSPDPTVVKAALHTAGTLPDPDLTHRLVVLLADPSAGHAAVVSLRQLGTWAVPFLAAALTEATPTDKDRLLARRMASVCAGVGTPESHQLLLELARRPDQAVRSAALRALAEQPARHGEAHQFRQWLNDELRLAQRLLHALLSETDPALTGAMNDELAGLLDRLFDLLTQLFDPETIGSVRTSVAHASRERRANALEMLDNLIPRTAYQTMQALLDDVSGREKTALVDAELGAFRPDVSITAYVLEKGPALFSDWTVGVALRRFTPADGPAERLLPYVEHPLLLLRDSAAVALDRLATQHPTGFARLRSLSPSLAELTMSHATATRIPEHELVLVLKNTSLFAQTPENVLTSVTPIMREVTYHEGQTIFNAGDLGTCMFIIYAGTVRISRDNHELARFGKGDFFGELALLDTEARSASADALTDVRLFRIDQDDFYDLMEERGEVLRSIVRTLCQRIRRQNQALAAARETAPAESR
jgi:HEAT repeat protein